jgi:hypothetical protein
VQSRGFIQQQLVLKMGTTGTTQPVVAASKAGERALPGHVLIRFNAATQSPSSSRHVLAWLFTSP